MLLFSDYFGVEKRVLEDAGLVDINLEKDTPLFIDPILIYGHDDARIEAWHKDIVDYLLLLNRLNAGGVPFEKLGGLIDFSEIPNNHLGFAREGTEGTGAGPVEARNLFDNIQRICAGREKAKSFHLEKIALLGKGFGKDHISDLICHILLRRFLDLTQEFAQAHISADKRKDFRIDRVSYDEAKRIFVPKKYTLPFFVDTKGRNRWIILTPSSILRKAQFEINRYVYRQSFDLILDFVGQSDEKYRQEINATYERLLEEAKAKAKQTGDKQPVNTDAVIDEVTARHPDLVDAFIALEEGNVPEIAENAKAERTPILLDNCCRTDNLFELFHYFTHITGRREKSFADSKRSVEAFRRKIENEGLWRLFYDKDGRVDETQVQYLFRMSSHSDYCEVIPESDAGDGSVDFLFVATKGDKTLIEFKLASNSNLNNTFAQIEVYCRGHGTKNAIAVFFAFSEEEKERVREVIADHNVKNITTYTIDCQRRPSASKTKNSDVFDVE